MLLWFLQFSLYDWNAKIPNNCRRKSDYLKMSCIACLNVGTSWQIHICHHLTLHNILLQVPWHYTIIHFEWDKRQWSSTLCPRIYRPTRKTWTKYVKCCNNLSKHSQSKENVKRFFERRLTKTIIFLQWSLKWNSLLTCMEMKFLAENFFYI